jgi:hypothetical protein
MNDWHQYLLCFRFRTDTQYMLQTLYRPTVYASDLTQICSVCFRPHTNQHFMIQTSYRPTVYASVLTQTHSLCFRPHTDPQCILYTSYRPTAYASDCISLQCMLQISYWHTIYASDLAPTRSVCCRPHTDPQFVLQTSPRPEFKSIWKYCNRRKQNTWKSIVWWKFNV